MPATNPDRSRIRFDEFEADLRTQELRRDGRAVRLPNQSFLILAALLEQPGELVTRETLRRRLWPEERFVDTEQSLNAAVNRLREALRDSADDPKYIETLPRRGYRFIGTVEREAEAQPVSAAPPEQTLVHESPPPGVLHKRVNVAVIAIGCMALLAIGMWMVLRTDREARRPLRLEPFTSFARQEIAPAFAPDGRHIAFAWNGEADGFDVYVK